MRALCWDGATAAVRDRPTPRADGERAVVRVSVAGICNTDLELTRGYMDFRGVLGHEFVGVVDEGRRRGAASAWSARSTSPAGTVPPARRGLGRHCPTRSVMGILNADGAFAEHVAVPIANLHAVPDGVADDAAAFCEPLAAAFEILEQVPSAAQSRCVVLGDGKLGLLAAQVLAAAGARVLAVGRHERKLAVLRGRGIEAVTLDAWDRTRADVVVEATGTAAGFALAVAATRPRGTVVLKSTVAHAAPLHLAPVVIDELTVVGSRCGPFAPALDALARGTVDVTSLISARRPLRDGVEALRLAAEPGVVKVLLEP